MIALGTPLLVVSPAEAPFGDIPDSGVANPAVSLEEMPSDQWLRIDMERARSANPSEPVKRRGQARISNTRCALVTCKNSCDIKGARDQGGRLVFFTPMNPSYNRVHAERVFCSISEARAAGYQG